MAEQRTEEQILDAFVKGSPGLSEEQPQQVAEQPAGTQNAQVEGQDAPAQEPVAEQPQEQVEQADAQTIEIDPEEALFEQEIDDGGKKTTQRLSLKELQQGYLRQKDYSQKTMELARQREELPRVLAKQAQETSETYGKRLSELQALVMKSVAAEFSNVDWNKLANEDAFEYVRLSNRRDQIKELLTSIQKEQETEGLKAREQKQQEKAQQWAKSLEVLQRDIPSFGPEVVKRLFDTGKDWGFEQSEIGEWTDHRLIKMLHALSDKKSVEAKRPEVEKKVALVTKIVKPGAKQVNRSAIDQARQNLRKTGKAEDALPIFEAMIRRS